jgi:hypothetical protein
METKIVFETLNAINVNQKTEKKNNLTYLSWAWAWAIIKKNYPDANYAVDKYGGKPYLFDENLGYLVSTNVTICGETIPMQLPVMDGANKAQKNIQYTYEVAEWVNGRKTGKNIEKKVESATMFDINTAIMRCLTKNLAMFGLGLYIYAGEDLPETTEGNKIDNTSEFIRVSKEISNIKTIEDLREYWTKNKDIVTKNKAIESLFIKRKIEIENQNGSII